IQAFPSLRVNYLYLNNKRAPLDNVEARQALVQAIDYKGIVDGILKGQAKLMNGPIPDGMWAHDPSLPLMQQNLDGAKASLAKVPQKI
ncbi:ABC transporter substrate-binding protein, partial [Pseudomonas sp. SIMBA_077]